MQQRFYGHHFISQYVTKIWYGKSVLSYVLFPISWVFRAIIWLRCSAYRYGWLKQTVFPVPVIIVGNITVGGTGKTPCVIALVNALRERGWQPGIVSRGYGGALNGAVHEVSETDLPSETGDEALLLKRRCQCPVVVGKKRVAAVRYLLETSTCDVIISDDGLQHYALSRQVEIVMIDGKRGVGNACCLPAGPLREPVSRIRQSDFVVVTGNTAEIDLPIMPSKSSVYSMALQMKAVYALCDETAKMSLSQLQHQTVHAIAGLGHPRRFFDMLHQLGLQVIEHAYPDHHVFEPADFAGFNQALIVMTEKDAVKCQEMALPNAWVVSIDGILAVDLINQLDKILKKTYG